MDVNALEIYVLFWSQNRPGKTWGPFSLTGDFTERRWPEGSYWKNNDLQAGRDYLLRRIFELER
jgi:hypothetical protein